jgi:hypothetical protein
MSLRITYLPKRGELAGSTFTPHRYSDGQYVVSKTRFKDDQVRLERIEGIPAYLDRGYKLRMSDPVMRTTPSLIGKDSIDINLV